MEVRPGYAKSNPFPCCMCLQSSVPTAGPKFDHVVFDVHGHSPLVRQYLQERNLSYNTKYSLLMKRTEIGQQPPYPTLVKSITIGQHVCLTDHLSKGIRVVNITRGFTP